MAPPTIFENNNTKEMVTKIRLCSPFPEVPKYLETKIAITKLQIAVKSLIEKVFNINLLINCLLCFYIHYKTAHQHFDMKTYKQNYVEVLYHKFRS